MQALKAQLVELLGQITRREFPGLRKDVTKQLAECKRELEGLGPSRQTEQEQRLFLSTMPRQFQEWVIKLDAERLETIAGEAPITKERRAAITKKAQDLERAMQILRR